MGVNTPSPKKKITSNKICMEVDNFGWRIITSPFFPLWMSLGEGVVLNPQAFEHDNFTILQQKTFKLYFILCALN